MRIGLLRGTSKLPWCVREASVGEPVIYPSPAHRPRGRELSTDVGWVGDRRAPKVGILVSATHGVKGDQERSSADR
ncbi:DUF2817 domain-containing protein [Bradyrhizobium sp. 45]|nr:DUF2817 domain-containing protein [Bradyrhizobium sp. 45]